jgi:hypothetical protein
MRGRDEAQLTVLLSEVNLARARVRAGRAAPQTTSARYELQLRCALLADAMQAYADAASGAGVPVPYRYRDELRLYRAMSSS